MPAPISVQLYSLREQLQKDYEGVIRRVAAMGYVGVEPAGFPGTTLEKAVKLYQELGLQISSAHMGLPIADKKQEVLDQAAALNTPYIVSGFGPDQFKTVAAVKESCEKFNQAAQAAATQGRKFAIHNHWWEFRKPEDGDRIAFEYMLEFLDQSVLFEVDTYWVQTGGPLPADIVKRLGPRAPLLHIKDGPCNLEKDSMMVAAGQGKVDFPAVVKAAGKNVQWMIVELDRCATDMIEAVAESQRYLVGKGLARGR